MKMLVAFLIGIFVIGCGHSSSVSGPADIRAEKVQSLCQYYSDNGKIPVTFGDGGKAVFGAYVYLCTQFAPTCMVQIPIDQSSDFIQSTCPNFP